MANGKQKVISNKNEGTNFVGVTNSNLNGDSNVKIEGGTGKKSNIESIVRVVYISVLVFLAYLAYSKGLLKVLGNKSRRYMPTVFWTFYEFIQKHKVLTLVIGFLISGEVRSMNSSLVDNIIMPLLAPVIPADKWNKSTKISIFEFGFGRVAADFIKFAVTLFIIFVLSRVVLFIDTGA